MANLRWLFYVSKIWGFWDTIDMMDEVGINVDGCGDQRILEISLEELRSDLAGFHSTVFQQQAREE